MAEQYEDDTYEEDFETGSSESNLVKDLRKQLNALSREKKELASELASLKTQSRDRSVADVLAANGVNSKIAKFIPADVETEDAIKEWLNENADVFGFEVNSSVNTDTLPPAEEIAASKRLQNLGANTQAPGKVQDIETRLANANSDAEIEEIWRDAKDFFL